MLVKYIRDGQKLVGCVVATGPNKIGVSIANPKDQFSKQLARYIAASRSETGTKCKIPNRFVNIGQDTNIPLSILVPVAERVMRERSERYFK